MIENSNTTVITVSFETLTRDNDMIPNGDCFYILRKWQKLGARVAIDFGNLGNKELSRAIVWCSNCNFFPDNVEVQANKNNVLSFDPGTGYLTMAIYPNFFSNGRVDWDMVDIIYTPHIKHNKIFNK